MLSRTRSGPRVARKLPPGSSIKPPDDGLMQDFVTFTDELIGSKDIDPVYPILKEMYDLLDLGHEERLWFTFLYMGFHSLPSAAAAFAEQPKPGPLHKGLYKLPMTMQRRNLRGGKLRSHVASYLDAIDGSTQDSWIRNGFVRGDATHNFEAFWLTSQSLWGNGRLTAYKWAEILEYVHGYEMRAPDMRLDQCLGPRRGVELVYDLLDAPTPPLNVAGDDVKARLQDGLGYELRWAEVETCLCDFAALMQGRFYIGHDVDEIEEHILDAPIEDEQKTWLMQARLRAIPHEYLGEIQGWSRRDDALRKSYRTEYLIQSRRGVIGKRQAEHDPASLTKLLKRKQANQAAGRKKKGKLHRSAR